MGVADDEVVGQVHSNPGAPPGQDEIVGGGLSGTRSDTGPTGLLDRSWVSLADIGKQPVQPSSDTPVRDLARNAAAATVRGSTAALDLLTNPSQLVLRPALTAGAAAYDYLQPKLGLPPMSDEQRADLTGVGAPPAERGNIAQIVDAAGNAAGVGPYSIVPKTSTEAAVATALEGAIPGAALGYLGPLGMFRGGVLGGGGALGGGYAASLVDPKWQPLVEMGTNAVIQGAGGAMTPRTGAGLDPAAVRIAQTARDEGVPFTAPDITPNSIFRTDASVARTSDALQTNMARDMGVNQQPGDLPGRITPTNIGQARTDAGADMGAITNTNNIGTMQTYRLLQQLQTAERQIDTTAGVTDADRAQMRARIAEIRGAVNRNTGSIDGTDYHSLTQTDSPLDRLAGNANSDMAAIGRGLMRNLDTAFRDSLSPNDQTAFSDAKYRYRLASTLDPLVDKYQGRTLPPGEVADALYGAQQKYGTVPGSQLDRFMSQAQLIAGGAAPRNPSVAGTLASPQASTALAVGGGHGLLTQLGQAVSEGLLGGYARNPIRTEDVFQRALSPATRLQQALAGAASATVP